MTAAHLDEVEARWSLARMAGEDADARSTPFDDGWDDEHKAAVIRSWQDIPALLREVKALRRLRCQERVTVGRDVLQCTRQVQHPNDGYEHNFDPANPGTPDRETP